MNATTNLFEQARKMQGWQSGGQRPRCANCRFAKDAAAQGIPALECWLAVLQPEKSVSVFQTGANAVCAFHAPQERP